MAERGRTLARAVEATAELEARRLLRCQAGPYPLVLDLPSLASVGTAGDRAVCVRRLLGVEPGAGAEEAVVVRDAAGEPVSLLFDRASDLVRVPLEEVHPLPALLRPVAALEPIRGVVRLEGGALAFLLDPVVAAGAAPEEPGGEA